MAKSRVSDFPKTELMKLNKNSYLGHYNRVASSLELLGRYRKIRDLADEKDPDIILYLRAAGHTTRTGITTSTLVKRCLASELGLDVNTFGAGCRAAQGVWEFVTVFGCGVVPTLPFDAMRTLTRPSIQLMTPVFPILKECCPWLQELYTFLQTHVWNVILNGQDIKIGTIRSGPDDSFVECLEQAVDEGR